MSGTWDDEREPTLAEQRAQERRVRDAEWIEHCRAVARGEAEPPPLDAQALAERERTR
jgi:hypothetical protein